MRGGRLHCCTENQIAGTRFASASMCVSQFLVIFSVEMMLQIESLQGLWRRSLILWPDGRRDTETDVAWLQGPSYYVDLRQPAGRPDFQGVAALRYMTKAQAAWAARQEGFAGQLRRDGAFFEWQRALDFQPASGQPDSGRLRLEGGILVEEGRYVPYVEHWHHDAGARTPCVALRLRDRATGCEGVLVRVGDTFMYARGRMAALPSGVSLTDSIEGAASLRAAQDLMDCEISIGGTGPVGWIIKRSSLPFKEGLHLSPGIRDCGAKYLTADLTPEGTWATREWDILDIQGDEWAASADGGSCVAAS
jgi:hypothetical protein